MNLSEMRRVAESATQGGWHLNKQYHGLRFRVEIERTKENNTVRPIAEFLQVSEHDAIHIATFSPQNCIRLLDVMEMMADNLDALVNEVRRSSVAYVLKGHINDCEKALAAYNKLKGE